MRLPPQPVLAECGGMVSHAVWQAAQARISLVWKRHLGGFRPRSAYEGSVATILRGGKCPPVVQLMPSVRAGADTKGRW